MANLNEPPTHPPARQARFTVPAAIVNSEMQSLRTTIAFTTRRTENGRKRSQGGWEGDEGSHTRRGAGEPDRGGDGRQAEASRRDRRPPDPLAYHEHLRRPGDQGVHHLRRLQGDAGQGVL